MIKKDRPSRVNRYTKDNKYFVSVYKVDPSYKARLDKLADEVWEYVLGVLVDSMSKDRLLILNKNDITKKFGALDKIVIPENEYSDYDDLELIEENIYRYLFGMIKDKTTAMDYLFKAKCPRPFELSMGIFDSEVCWAVTNSSEVKEMIEVYKNKLKSEMHTLKSMVIYQALDSIYSSFLLDRKDMHSIDNSDIVRYSKRFRERELSREELLDLRIALELELKKFKLRVDKKGNGIEIRNWYNV